MEAGMSRKYAELNPDSNAGPMDAIDLSGLFSALISLLDAWVDKGIDPPPSKADVAGFDPALALPEVACPLGVYYAPGSGMFTRFEPFAGFGLEPELKGTPGAFLDMNGNSAVDLRETVTAAWKRLGLIGSEDMDEERYATCLAEAARNLIDQRLLPPATDDWYRKTAAEVYRLSGAKFK